MTNRDGAGEELRLFVPRVEELGFYRDLLADPATMAYNAPWFPPDGCLPFPEEDWADWHAQWVGREPERFFAYLFRPADGAVVGDVNYHYDPERDWWDLGVLIRASERGKGCGSRGLALLLDRAFRVDGVTRLHNEFEPGRKAALAMHKAAGFRELGMERGNLQLLLTARDYEEREA